MAPKVKLGPITVTDTPADPFDDFLEALATGQPGFAGPGLGGMGALGQGALGQAQQLGAQRADDAAKSQAALEAIEGGGLDLDSQTMASQPPVDPNFSVGAAPTAPALTASDKAALQQQANQGAAGQNGLNPMAVAALAGQLPGFGAQLGRFINTVSDKRAKTDIHSADPALEAFLTAVGG